MGHRSKINNLVSSRLFAFGVPTSVIPSMISQIHHWNKYHGEEWTVDRLKNLKTIYIQRLSGNSDFKLPYISLNKKGIPKGPFSWCFKKGRNVQTCLNVLSVYKCFVSRSVTRNQRRKFFGSLTRTPPDENYQFSPEFLPTIRDRLSKGKTHSKWYVDSFTPGHSTVQIPRTNDYRSWISSEVKRAPVYWDMKTKPESEITLTEFLLPLLNDNLYCLFDWVAPETLYQLAIAFGYDVESLGRMVNNHFKGKTFPSTSNSPLRHPPPVPVGRISFIQEPGYKLRAVANPLRVFQYALAPLGSLLFDVLRNVETDYSFNQEEGVTWVQTQLRLGNTVHSIDLSDATNNFPMSIQMAVLNELSPKWVRYVRGFEYVARSIWVTPEGDHFQWSVGQPLGLYPSFASFALAHNFLLEDLCIKNGISFRYPPYAIIGDDVVIWNDRLAEAYHQTMASMQVPISLHKSLVSNTVAEFGGRVITKEKVFLSHKYGIMSDFNFVDVVRQLGPRCVKFLRPRQRKLIEAMAPIPEPVGLGWNPKGLPLESRVASSKIPDLFRGQPFRVSDHNTGETHYTARDFSGFSSYWIPPRELGGIGQPDQGRSLPPSLKVLQDLSQSGLPIGHNLSKIEFDLRLSRNFWISPAGESIARGIGYYQDFRTTDLQKIGLQHIKYLLDYVAKFQPKLEGSGSDS